MRAGDVVQRLEPVAPQMIGARMRLVLQQRSVSAQAARRAASAPLQRQQTALSQATLEADRAMQLAKDNFLAAAARDPALLARLAAQQALRAVQAELSAADDQLAEAQAALNRAEPAPGAPRAGRSALNGPVDGVVLERHQDSAAPVAWAMGSGSTPASPCRGRSGRWSRLLPRRCAKGCSGASSSSRAAVHDRAPCRSTTAMPSWRGSSKGSAKGVGAAVPLYPVSTIEDGQPVRSR